MTGAISGSGANSKAAPRYTMMNIQTSAQGLVIPICYGRSRIAPNLIWYGGFKSVAAKQGGKGGGGGKGASSYTYYADVILGLCEGVVTNVFQVYKGQSAQLLSQDNMILFEGGQGQAPWSHLTSAYPTQALSYSGTAYVAAAQLNLGSSPDLPDYAFEVAATLWNSISGLDDANPADIMYDYITNPYYGLSPNATWLDAASLQQYRSYCGAQGILFSPYFSEQEQVTNTFQRWSQMTNSFIFWSGNVLKFVPLGATALTGNGYTYTPQITPVYNLTYDDIIAESRGKEPVTVSRVDPADGYNQVQLDIRDRNNAYNTTSIYWSDPASVNQYGQLQSNIIEATEICLQSVANIAASLLGQRSVYVRNTYTFKLGYGFVLLEPGDIVTITEPNIGLNRFPVRIQSVQEGDDQILTIVAEEFPASIGIPAQLTYQPSVSNPTYDPNTPPGNVNPPAIFEPNAMLSGGPPQVWVGLSGGAYYGGSEVYISFDGVNYSGIGSQAPPINQGTLVNNIGSSSSTLDTSSTLVVNMLGVGSLPTTATNADAAAGRTLLLVDRELMAYGTVSVGTIASQYDITYLERGLYGTAIAPHYAGSNPVTSHDAPTGSTALTFSSAPSVGVGQFLPGVPAGIAPGAVITGVSGTVITMDQPTIADVPAGSTVTALGALVSRIDESIMFEYNLPAQYINSKLYFKFAAVNVFGNNIEALTLADEYTYTPAGVQYTVYPPTGLTAVPSASGATLSWTPNPASNTTYYEVYVNTVNNFSTATAYVYTTAGTGQTLVGLTPGTTYYFWVVAGNSVNVSSPSSSATCAAGAAGSVMSGGSAASTITPGTGVMGTVSGGALTISATGIDLIEGSSTFGPFITIDIGPGLTANSTGTISATEGVVSSGTLYPTLASGTNINFSGTGSTLTIATTGTLPGNVTVQNNGTSAGVAGTLDVVGNITASVAGGVATISSTGSAPFLSLSSSATLTHAQTNSNVSTTGFTGSGTITLGTAPTAGDNYTIYGNASYAITITAASGSILFPDGSSAASYALPLSSTDFISLLSDGTNWRAATSGRNIVANAVNANEAAAIGQILGGIPANVYVNKSSVRAYSTVYTNSTGRAIYVTTIGYNSSAGAATYAFVNGTQLVFYQNAPTALVNIPVLFIVPPGGTYAVYWTSSSTSSLSQWWEY